MESVFKVIIVGEPTVGKTTFVSMYCHKQWLGNYKPTTGADFAVKNLKWSDTDSVRLHLWDIAGQDYARVTARTYYKGALGCIIMFDLTSRKTLEECQHWKKDVESRIFLNGSESIPCVLVANKDDLPNKVITAEEVESFSRAHGFLGSMCVSVKQNKHLADAMNMLVEKMMANEHETREVSTNSDSLARAAQALPTASPNGNDSRGNRTRLSGDDSRGNRIRLSGEEGKSADSGGCCYSSKSHRQPGGEE